MQSNNWFRRISITTTWLWLGLFALLPTLALFMVALLDRTETDFFIPVFTLDNFARLFSPAFATVLWDSLWLAVISTLFCLLLGYPFAYALAKVSKRWRPWLLLLVIIPFWTNSLIRTYSIMMLLGAQGMINKILGLFGISPIAMMYSDFAVFVGLAYTMLPFMVLPLYASIEKLDPALRDAAKDLGAGTLRTFWHITLPLTMPGIVAGCILVFLPCLGMFYVPEVLGGATNMLLGTFIKDQFLVYRHWPFGAAASSVLTILLLLLGLIYRLVARRQEEKQLLDSGVY